MSCVKKIFENNAVHVARTVAVNEILKDNYVSAKDPFRLDSEDENYVEIITEKLIKTIDDLCR